MSIKTELRKILAKYETQECIDALESLGKELRRKNSQRINKEVKQLSRYVKFDGERPDLAIMK